MSVNGIQNNTSPATDKTTTKYNTNAAQLKNEAVKDMVSSTLAGSKDNTTAAIFERSSSNTADSSKKIYSSGNPTVDKMKSEIDEKTSQLQSLVNTMFSKQGKSAVLSENQFWRLFADGKVNVDAATRKQAQEDISDDGYFGVKKTSERILDFAKALAGDDPKNIDKLQKAFEKGFKQATAAWGKKLPDISQKTHDAVLDGFAAWKKEYETDETTTAETK